MSRLAGEDPPARIIAWLSEVGDELHERLVRADLTSSRTRSVPNVAAFVDQFIQKRSSVKPATIRAWAQARNQLVSYFGADRRLDDITTGDAKDWMIELQSKPRVIKGETVKGFAEATRRKWAGFAKQFFESAVDHGLIDRNPFRKLKSGSVANPARNEFISQTDTLKVIDQCPDAEWRLIIALSRFGGLRCPSEHLALRWEHILWNIDRINVMSPKTEHVGKAERVIPLFPELRPFLEAAFEDAPEGAEFVIHRHRGVGNFRTQMTRLVRLAGLTPWPRIFHNLRASRQTELTDKHPEHVVCAWIGNTQSVARRHYEMVTDEHFDAAVDDQARRNKSMHGLVHNSREP